MKNVHFRGQHEPTSATSLDHVQVNQPYNPSVSTRNVDNFYVAFKYVRKETLGFTSTETIQAY